MNKTKNLKINWILFDVFDIVAFLVFVVWLVLFIRFFVFNPYSVVGQSMATEIAEWDFLLIDKMWRKIGDLERWDIVVFVPEWRDIPYIKRIIWLPGETVKIQDGEVALCEDETATSCETVDEPYLHDGTKTNIRCNTLNDGVFTTTDGYFVIGDNRDHSTDSRCCFTIGCYKDSNFEVRDSDIIGKLFIRLYPFNSIKTF